MLLALLSKKISLHLLNRWGSDLYFNFKNNQCITIKSFRQIGLDFSKSIYLDRKCPNRFYFIIKPKIGILDEIMNHSDNEQAVTSKAK